VPAHRRMRAFDRDLIRGGHYGQRSCEPHLQAEHMAAPTNAANVKKVLANPEPSTHGTSRTLRDVRPESGMRTKTDVRQRRCRMGARPGLSTAPSADLGCPAPFSKIFLFPLDPNHLYVRLRLVPLEGRFAIVTDAGRDAVDAGCVGRVTGWQGGLPIGGACERSTARGRTTLVADGKAVSFWHPLLVSSRRRR
jgi:hypothetical protein